MKIKESSSWFAASGCMLEAACLLSDGAFKLFVYICLTCDRQTGRLPVAQGELARALRKSRRSISSYLDELSQKGVCLVRPAPNQHHAGEIEVADAFWPYHKHSEHTPDARSDYLDRIRAWMLQYPIIRSSFGAADRRFAAEMFGQGIALDHIDKALLLGTCRKYIAALNSTSLTPIYSLRYFASVVEEVAHTDVADSYWEYLRRRVKDLNDAWVDRLISPRRPRAATQRAMNTQEGINE